MAKKSTEETEANSDRERDPATGTPQTDPDIVEEAGRESFPTSDPPSWTLGVEEDSGDDAE